LAYGWAWLVYNTTKGSLEIITTLEHGWILSDQPKLIPLMAIDVYFKKDDANFVKNMWQIINWKKVAERLPRNLS